MAISVVTCLVTNEGKSMLIDSMVNNTLTNLIRFKVGDGATTDADASVTDLQNTVVIKDTVQRIKVDYNKMEFHCVLDPSDGNLTNLNELGIYYYDSINGIERLFIYATYPEITKNDTTGLEFIVTLTI